MIVKESIGLLTGVLILAGIAFAISRGSDTANVIKAAGAAFAGLVNSATLQNGAG